MKGYENFEISAYAWAYYLNRSDEEKLRNDLKRALEKGPIAKIYVENHRGRADVPKEKLILAKKVYEEMGVKTAGGITATVLEGERKPSIMDVFCYTDTRHRDKFKAIVKDLSEVFDEIILDDYFFTSCRCEKCIEAKGKMTWAQYRTKLMTDFSKEIVDLAHSINPNLKFVIKYPNWYESFAENGYAPGTQKDIFDGIFSGTESRTPLWSQQHLQAYMSYSNVRLMENTAPGRNGGGWIDPGGSADNANIWIKQADYTLLAGGKELMLFNYEWMIGNPIFSYLETALRRTDAAISKLGKPVGVKAYEPYDGEGEDQLYNYLGMIGIPIEPVREFDEKASLMFLAQNALIDEDVFEKLEKYVRAGGNAVITTGFFKGVYDKGIKDMTSVRLTGRHISGSEYSIGNRNFNTGFTASGREKVGFEVLNYKTNSTWADIFVQDGEDNFPVMTEDQYGKGRLFILNEPENFAQLFKLPSVIRETIAKHMTIGLPVYATCDPGTDSSDNGSRAGGRISLFEYDNGCYAITNHEDRAANVRLIVRGDMYGNDETGWYGDQADEEPGTVGGLGVKTKTDENTRRPIGAEDIESGALYTNVSMLPKPAWRHDSCSIIPEPLEYVITVPVMPGAIKYVKVKF
jgi:hypothetical protein